ncbi:MAG: FtsW/RodA/SpoVE family cell cycle protein [Candidatus Pacebacteria bacterium]|nr:FtsW/RodA/SpoVE family cell cycle protein [Candidatus Paceibacterota bacterium]
MFKKLDKGILYMTFIMIFVGIIIFFSASLSGLENTDFFASIFLKQIVAIFLGLAIFFFLIKTKSFSSQSLRKYSVYIFFVTAIIQLLVLVPNIGLEYKGAMRWIDLGVISIQPSEFFKYSLIIFFSAVIATRGEKLKKFKNFLILGTIFTLPVSAFFIYIHDFGTLMSILLAYFIILLLSANKNWHLFLVTLIGGISIGFLAYNFVPYAQHRIDNFLSQNKIEQASYHNKQMIYTIGAGQITGRGYGASLQKYSGLIPEPLGDSIFPIYAEEVGFVGSVILIILFFFLSFFIFISAKKRKNSFEKMTMAGLGTLIIFPIFYNISASMSLVPLSGMPITFISKGGTAIFSAIVIMGLLLRISRER